jgi:hypothetical protein
MNGDAYSLRAEQSTAGEEREHHQLIDICDG